jgi:nucleotide-binding universal stress UspA family protein
MTSRPIARSAGEALPSWSPRALVCGVDGSRGSAEAVRQALTLAGSGSHVDFALVEWTTGHGTSAQASVAPARAAVALDEAAHLAAEAGVESATRTVRSNDPASALVELARDADLLVVGATRHSRAGGIVLGRVSTAAAHRSPCDVLIARPEPHGHPFAERILVGFDGSQPARRAVAIAGEIARRHGSRLTVASFWPSTAERRHATSEVVVALTELTGSEPVVVSGDGAAHERLAQLATGLEASLVVVGSRGLTGVSALGSVSERVAHAVPCSVLIARGGGER